MPKRARRARLVRREVTSDDPNRIRMAGESTKRLKSQGYRSNPADRTESMYLKPGSPRDTSKPANPKPLNVTAPNRSPKPKRATFRPN